MSIPHPFDRFRGEVISRRGLEQLLPYADIVEVFNSRNTFGSDDRKAEEFAKKYNLLVSGVSDAHTTMELGRTYMLMPDFDGTPSDFKRILSEATIVKHRTNPLIHVLTRLTRFRKRLANT